jgi:aspartate/methionine/tyrosine aminotransferase
MFNECNYPPVEFYKRARKNIPKGNIKISSGISCFPPSKAFLKIVKKAHTEAGSKVHDYCDPGGEKKARSLLAKLENLRGGHTYYNLNNVFITNGTTEGIDAITFLLSSQLNTTKGMCFIPVYYTLGMCAASYGIELNHIATVNQGQWKISIDDISTLPENALVYINNPNAITGRYICDSHLENILLKAKEKKLWILYDEIIREMTWFPDVPSITEIASRLDCLDRVFLLYGPAKDKSVPGLRIGYLYVPESTKGAVRDLLIQRTFSVPHIYSKVALYDAILSLNSLGVQKNNEISVLHEQHDAHMKHIVKKCKENIELILSLLDDVLVNFTVANSGYSLFVQVENNRLSDQLNFTTNMSKNFGVDIAPGPMFGLRAFDWEENYGMWIRINVSLSDDLLLKGCTQLRLGLRNRN